MNIKLRRLNTFNHILITFHANLSCHALYADGSFIYDNFNHLYNPANNSILFRRTFQ